MMQEFVQQLADSMNETVRNMHTCLPGRIDSYDPETGRAQVTPVMKMKTPRGDRIQYPQISGVPVVMAQTQGAVLAHPIKKGDSCLIVIAEQALDLWMYGKDTDTDLAFDLTNAVCIPGLFVMPHAAVKEACRTDSIILQNGNVKLTVADDRVQIDAPEILINGNTTVTGNFTTRGGIVNLN